MVVAAVARVIPSVRWSGRANPVLTESYRSQKPNVKQPEHTELACNGVQHVVCGIDLIRKMISAEKTNKTGIRCSVLAYNHTYPMRKIPVHNEITKSHWLWRDKPYALEIRHSFGCRTNVNRTST